MRLIDVGYGQVDTGNGDLPAWGETVQTLPPLTVVAPNPFNLTPQVINTTRPELPMVQMPAPRAPWLLYLAIAVGAWFVFKGRGRGAREWV